MTPTQSMLNATLLGYVAGLAWGDYGNDIVADRNPYQWIQPEFLNWCHGFWQGKARRNECGVHDPLPPEPLQCVVIRQPDYPQAWKDFKDWLDRARNSWAN